MKRFGIGLLVFGSCVGVGVALAKPCHHLGLGQQQLADVTVFINPQAQEARHKAKHLVQVRPLRFAVAAASSYKNWKNDVADLLGSLDFPALIQVKTARLRLGLEVGADGSTQNVRLQQSSGNPAVDDAVEKTMRVGMPWPTLPVKLLKSGVGTKPLLSTATKNGDAQYALIRKNQQHYGLGVQIVWPRTTVQGYKAGIWTQMTTQRMQ